MTPAVRLGLLLSLPLVVAAVQPDQARYSCRARPKFEERRQMTRQFPATQVDAVLVHNQFGNVVIQTHVEPTVRIDAEIVSGADTKEKARHCLERLTLLTELGGRHLTVTVVRPESGVCGTTHYETAFTLTLPEMLDVTVENSFGAVTANDRCGRVKITNRFGDAGVHRSRSAEVTSSFGDVNVADLQGDLSVENRFGRVTAQDIAGSVRLRNENGSIALVRGTGPARIEGRQGDIVITGHRGRSQVDCEYGSVEYQQTEQGADTASIVNRSGAVRLTLPAAASARISAHVSQGRIEATLPGVGPVMSSGDADQTWTNLLGDGLAVFDLNTSGGRILIDTR